MTTFYLIRHAESDFNLNHSHLVGGRSSHSPLSDRGLVQADKLAKRLKQENIVFDHWVSSSAVRTQQTAKPSLALLDPQAKLIIEPTIEEIHQGDWEGKLRTECYTPDVMAAIKADNHNFKAPNGESQYEREVAMMCFLDKWAENEKDATIAVFTHGVSIKCALRGIYEWSPKMTYTTHIDNTSITVVRKENERWHVERVNDYAHLKLI